MNDKEILKRGIEHHLSAIMDFFKDHVEITLIIRNPGHEDGSRDAVISNSKDYEKTKNVLKAGFIKPVRR